MIEKPCKNCFIIWASDKLIQTYHTYCYQAKILVWRHSQANWETYFLLDDLFLVQWGGKYYIWVFFYIVGCQPILQLGINQSYNYLFYLFNILQTFCQSRCASLAQFSSESELEKIVNEIRSLSLPQSGRRFILDSISSGMLKLYLLKSFKNKKKIHFIVFV